MSSHLFGPLHDSIESFSHFLILLNRLRTLFSILHLSSFCGYEKNNKNKKYFYISIYFPLELVERNFYLVGEKMVMINMSWTT